MHGVDCRAPRILFHELLVFGRTEFPADGRDVQLGTLCGGHRMARVQADHPGPIPSVLEPFGGSNIHGIILLNASNRSTFLRAI